MKRQYPEKSMYEGFNGQRVNPVDSFMEDVIDYMTDIYGNIAAMYYVVERVDNHDEDDTATFHLQVVVSSVVAGDAHADDTLHDQIPSDLAETVKQVWELNDYDKIRGWDLNPIQDGPDLNVHNGW